MAISIQATDKILLSLAEGKTLRVTGKPNTSGTIYKTPDGSTANATRTWAVGSNSTQTVGPYESATQFVFTCDAGQIDILEKEAGLAAIAGAALGAGQLVYLRPDGMLAPADATVEGREAVGFVKSNHAQGTSARYYSLGDILGGLEGLTPGATYYLSTTPGALAASSAVSTYGAGNVVMAVGKALSSTELLFSPSAPITL